MARFRLRFLLQEFDLAGPEVVIGRSPDCHITIEDPLVSRNHAKLTIQDDEARIQDLGSRNGVRVNGRHIQGEHKLADGDRIRLGTQELVFYIVKGQDRPARPTGFMRVCGACGTPYPEGAQSCPHCGSTEPREEDTISGLLVEPRRSWTFQLLGEVIERALSTGRATEADRLMRRAAKEIDERISSGDRLDPNNVAMISAFALRLAKLVGTAEWIQWALDLHQRQSMMPSDAVIDRLTDLDREGNLEIKSLVDQFCGWARQSLEAMPQSSLAGLTRLEKICNAAPS